MNAIANVYDILKSQGLAPKNKHTGDFGIEIETETLEPYDYPSMKFWKCDRDGSLRDFGVEYILKAPLAAPDLEVALEEFSAADKLHVFRKGSISTSVHVHVNFLNDTFLNVANFLTTWSLVENLLIRYSGPDRLSNLFCFPLCDAEGTVEAWCNMLQTLGRKGFGKAAPNNDRVKYSALNIAPLFTLGTLEARTFRGETDVEIINTWVGIIGKIKEFSLRENLTPPGVLEMWKYLGPTGFIDFIFQEYSGELKWDDTSDLMKKNAFYAARIASAVKKWEGFAILKVKPVYKEQIRDQIELISQDAFKATFDQLPYHERLMVYEIYHRANQDTKIVDALDDI